MNPFAFAMRRPFAALFLLLALAAGGVLGLAKMHAAGVSPIKSPRVNEYLASIDTHADRIKEKVVSHLEAYLHPKAVERHEEHHKIVVTSPEATDVTLTRNYVCQIHSKQHIKVCAMEGGYLTQILIQEGQRVRKGDVMFKVVPTLYESKLKAEMAEAQLARLEYNYTKKLSEEKVISPNEVALLQAKMERAQAKAALAQAELNFTDVRAPFDGIVDRLHEQLGSLIKEGDVLTTLSDNSTMWVYFNVPEADYLAYMEAAERSADQKVELVLANHETFSQVGRISAIEAKFNNETGNIPFRADFPNPKGLLRHGQTGNVMLSHVSHNAVVIPQRSVFEVLAKRYVYVVDKDDVVHQREITVRHEMDDIFVIDKGLAPGEKIVLEGGRQIHDGEKVEYEFNPPALVMANLKFKAE
ncbi:Efflux pump periplasmic linker BepF [Aquisphaera giovannonii]|uniref:Efflux pump periplasmic linker BepF n=1 Tax=Aquisphaera giovannonii TaxID=406548 RepID=A0A5B9VTD8_9BACT|nr:efflux RND transporter periplasmic adaptor subunit [Aquisphaera giovannonii]QEH31766.1 Efflux pump periplasmic linker BepF [Aquisphaera giovannonii]